MAITPVEIRHVRLERALLGYGRGPTDRLLEEITDSFEAVWRERADLVDRVEALEGELQRYRDLEGLLRTTLVSAERNAQELKEQAKRESDLLLEEAHAEGRAIIRGATAERERLRSESHRIRTVLAAALAVVEEDEVAALPERADADPGRAEAA